MPAETANTPTITQPTHIVIRATDGFQGFAGLVDAHNSISGREGEVWFGKLGRPIARPRLEKIKQSIQQGKQPRVVLAITSNGSKGARRNLNVFSAVIRGVSRETPPEGRDLPSEYEELGLDFQVGAWFLIEELRPEGQELLDLLRIASSEQSARDALRTSMAGAFFCVPF